MKKMLILFPLFTLLLAVIFLKPQTCANSISCIKDLSGMYDADKKEGVFLGKNILAPQYLALEEQSSDILGETSGSNKHIDVDLTNQKLLAYEGDKLVYEFPVSTGKWGKTPTGLFSIWIKLRYTRMEGGSSALGTYYNLPNVPYTMFFYSDSVPKSRGFGLHGAYWHNNFGHPMSHGCVNMRPADAETIYYWSGPRILGASTYATKDNPGTPINIFGTAPNE